MEAWDEGVPAIAMREISVLREVRHPNIVGLEDVFVSFSGNLYLVFELLDNDLRQLMERRRGTRLPLNLIKSFVCQILRGVDECHVHRVIHRDLKPQNILIGRSGYLKLADFGLARPFAVPVRPYTHEVITLWYRAPEILMGQKVYTTSVDLWSVGCIFAEMALGRPLFTGDSEFDQIMRIFPVRGTPTEEMWPGVTELPNFLGSFPNWGVRDLSRMPFNLPEEGLDLLARMLTYSPQDRITAAEALRHPFLAEVAGRDPADLAAEAMEEFLGEPLAPHRGVSAAEASHAWRGGPSASGAAGGAGAGGEGGGGGEGGEGEEEKRGQADMKDE